ncbi:response regulator [Candidatus Omnitrophota bacterium]
MIKRILLVDDTPVTVAMVKNRLEKNGYLVTIATNGLEGLKETKNHDFDLIITDVIMPVMDGVDFYKALKINPKTSSIPIVIITDNEVFKNSFRTLGVEGFVPKPLDTTALINQIEASLKNKAKKNSQSNKVLVVGTDKAKVDEMLTIIAANGFQSNKADDSQDFFARALKIVPDIVMLDVLLHDVTPQETIHALKCFGRFRNLQILTFSCLPIDLNQNVNHDLIKKFQFAIKSCNSAGANHYIGRFSPTEFGTNFNKFLK